MYRIIKIILSGLLFFSIYFGSNQLGNHSDVFAGAMLRCCNNGLCQNEGCYQRSSILLCSGTEYSSTCLDCMDEVYELYPCGKYLGTLPAWCNMPNGVKYYAGDF